MGQQCYFEIFGEKGAVWRPHKCVPHTLATAKRRLKKVYGEESAIYGAPTLTTAKRRLRKVYGEKSTIYATRHPHTDHGQEAVVSVPGGHVSVQVEAHARRKDVPEEDRTLAGAGQELVPLGGEQGPLDGVGMTCMGEWGWGVGSTGERENGGKRDLMAEI